MAKKEKRIISVDLIRVLAILLVIVFHLLFILTHNNSLRPIGFVGVSLFFIVSGFVLVKHYSRLEEFSFKWFFKRYIKIASLYYFALIVFVLLFSKQVYSGSLFKNLLLHALFLDFLTPETMYSIIGSAWFLPPLIGLYILFPYLNKFTKKSLWFLVFVFVVMSVVRGEYLTLASFPPLFFIGEFCFGIAFAYNKKVEALLISLLIVLIDPMMVIPFAIFFVVFSFKWKFLSSKILSVIAANTLLLFLFHEAFIETCLGDWKIYSLNKFNGLFLLSTVTLVSVYLSGRVRNYFSMEKSKKRKNEKVETLKAAVFAIMIGYSGFLVFSIIFAQDSVLTSPAPILSFDYFDSSYASGRCYVEGSVSNAGGADAVEVVMNCRRGIFPLLPLDGDSGEWSEELGQIAQDGEVDFSFEVECSKPVRFECDIECENC
ncbi:MAG: acyltransferase [Nanoarchaeota archaeon]|nr:acyltransferase [Nanoarchaeota archaeon]MBU1103598.1 acyltransferase [Nanoarchaeota archaeon]